MIPFPAPQPEKLSCCTCYHVAFGTKGLYCTYFNEAIVFDDVAEDCGQYVRD